MDIMSFCLGIGIIRSSQDSLLPSVIGNYDTFFVSDSRWETMSDDLWGKVLWLLQKWEIPSLSVSF